MTPEILSQLRARMQSQPRSLTELQRAAAAAGSPFGEDQVALLLACLPDVTLQGGQYQAAAGEDEDPVARALLALLGPEPTPAASLVRRLPREVVTTPAALCELARQHPQLELVGASRIRRR